MLGKTGVKDAYFKCLLNLQDLQCSDVTCTIDWVTQHVKLVHQRSIIAHYPSEESLQTSSLKLRVPIRNSNLESDTIYS